MRPGIPLGLEGDLNQALRDEGLLPGVLAVSSSSTQCFHWDRLYSEMSAGIGATVIARVVAGVVVVVVGSWVGIEVAASVEDADAGVAIAVVDPGVPWGGVVGMMFVGDVVMELGSASVRLVVTTRLQTG